MFPCKRQLQSSKISVVEIRWKNICSFYKTSNIERLAEMASGNMPEWKFGEKVEVGERIGERQ